MSENPPVLCALYVPGDRPERFEKAAVSGADVVVIDLEDAVSAAHKQVARRNAVEWLREGARRVRCEVRVNADARWRFDDLAAIRDFPGLAGVRLPKVEFPMDVRDAAALLSSSGKTRLVALIESARGVEAAYDIARAHPLLSGIALGEADLASDLGTTGEDALSWARSRIVVAARAAGLVAPMMSVYPHVSDLDGLSASSRAGRALGMVGRSAIHPRQVPVIVEAFAPSREECARAEEVLATASQGQAAGSGVGTTADGRMVDPAMLGRARSVLALADAAKQARRRLAG